MPRKQRAAKREKLKTSQKLVKTISNPKMSKKAENIPQTSEKDEIKVPSKDGKTDLNTIYRNIKSIPNFSAKINDFLRADETHSKHRRIVKHKFPRRRIIVHYPFQIFMTDLIEYSQPGMKQANRGYVYILIFIDCFTKKVFARPLKKKNSFEMASAIDSILQELEHFPNSVISDEGLEYYNSKVKSIFQNHFIHHYSIKTKMKACIVERFNRTLKNRFEKYFYENKTKNWISVLNQFVSNYNQTFHRSIGMSPDEVNDKNAQQVFAKLYPHLDVEVAPRLSKGDRVRILVEKTIFQKGYTQSWSDEIFTISRVKQAASRVWYEIKSADGTAIPGIKYFWEVNLVQRQK